MEQNRRKAAYRRDKQHLVILNAVLSIILAVSLLLTGVFGVFAYVTDGARYSDLSSNLEDLGIISDTSKNLPKGIVNIALFGLDSRKQVIKLEEGKSLSGLSDAIIILSIDTVKNTVKLTSILRDSWVPINVVKNDGKVYSDYNKINAAYSYGGAQGAVKTLNENFHLNITDYVSVGLFQLENIINIFGGVDIEITEKERQMINVMSNLEGFSSDYLPKAGLVHLDGAQAVAYSRIRKLDSEEVRVLRQTKVLNCLFEKAKIVPVSEYPQKINAILDSCETSLEFSEIMNYASSLLKISDLHLQHVSVPGSEVVAQGGIFSDTRGGWVWKYDLDEASKFIYKWIYE